MGLAYRVIARLDIKGQNVVKGIQFEGLRVMGNPAEMAARYAEDADELLYIDTVATLYGRNQLNGLIEETSAKAFIPITVGGGIQRLEQINELLRSGADRAAINTGAIKVPSIIERFSGIYGSQAISVSVECKRTENGWMAYTDNGREPSGKDAIQWAEEAVRLGAGEILITSIDRDGTRKGPDIELLKRIQVDVPVVYSGGIRLCDVAEVAEYSDGMAIGASLHYGDCTIRQVKDALRASGKEIR